MLLAACCAFVLTASAADPVPNILVNGEIADANDVNANFQALVDQITVLETQLAAQASQLTTLDNTVITLDGTVTTLDSTITTQGDQITVLEGDTSTLQGQLVPVGTILPYGGPNPPAGFLLCDGAAVDRTIYADLFAAIGASWGYGDNVSKFNLPDLRGRFLRGVDGGTGNDPEAGSRTPINTGGNPGDLVGSLQADDFASHFHYYDVSQQTRGTAAPTAGFGMVVPTGAGDIGPYDTFTSGGTETRPKNAYVNYIIKY